MNGKIVEKIRSEKQQPLIAVVGAQFPNKDYDRNTGIETGYLLRKHIGSRPGTLFTGGVEGVGVDIYTGVIRRCVDELRESARKTMPDDRFFVLLPKFGSIKSMIPFEIPEAYNALGSLSKRNSIDVVFSGDHLAERREYLANVADILIVVNGGVGTIDEAVIALQNKKPVITLSYSGGAALMLSAQTRHSRFMPFATHALPFGEMISDDSRNLIFTASNAAEMLLHLDSLV
ncbi:MAG: LOG family protein [Candidatus Micrarchaeota archaeon]|nr:LOG family protein [Candidatus Micrarchaeota archaeon]MDE1824148.1 LOG family protein [Candidatus Micrarchaeota archaeon]MDE1849921.1 LOG family protein [Candidatus Micrarchaeota archaeon]